MVDSSFMTGLRQKTLGVFSLDNVLTMLHVVLLVSATLIVCLVVDAWKDLNPNSQKIGLLGVILMVV
ncbi:hypothetical protein ACFX2J_045501 [Malus domestica]